MSDDISSRVQRVSGACLVHRRVKKMPEILEARVRSNEGWNLKFCRSVDEEAVRAARVPIRRFGSEESEATHGRYSGAICGTWGRVASSRLTGFLGFPRGRPRSTSVGSVSTGEGLMCIDMKS